MRLPERFLAAFCLLALGSPHAPAASFDEEIRPFLADHCIRCHGPEKQKGKLRLDTLGADFSDRDTAEGFDKVSTALLLDPSLMQHYYEVARRIAANGFYRFTVRAGAHRGADGMKLLPIILAAPLVAAADPLGIEFVTLSPGQ